MPLRVHSFCRLELDNELESRGDLSAISFNEERYDLLAPAELTVAQRKKDLQVLKKEAADLLALSGAVMKRIPLAKGLFN